MVAIGNIAGRRSKLIIVVVVAIVVLIMWTRQCGMERAVTMTNNAAVALVVRRLLLDDDDDDDRVLLRLVAMKRYCRRNHAAIFDIKAGRGMGGKEGERATGFFSYLLKGAQTERYF